LTLYHIAVALDFSLFGAGQAYTALSRATSLASLSIIHLDRDAFIVDRDALTECELLERRWNAFKMARDNRRQSH
jgi:hypothetical protein